MKEFFGVIASMMPDDPNVTVLGDLFYEASAATTWEIRIDAFGKRINEGLKSLCDYRVMLSKKKVILTLRSSEQGGKIGRIELYDQYKFWRDLPPLLTKLIRSSAAEIYVDWGLDLIQWIEDNGVKCPLPWMKIGASFHDFSGGRSPEYLDHHLNTLLSSRARGFLKFVITARYPGDVTRLTNISQLLSKDPRPSIFFAMGKDGQDSRKSCMAWGSSGTYGCLPGRVSAAPGQLTIHELLSDPDVQKRLITALKGG